MWIWYLQRIPNKGGHLLLHLCSPPFAHPHPHDLAPPPPLPPPRQSPRRYDYARRQAARGVARTTNFWQWDTSGGDLPGDAIFAAADCQPWNVSWTSGCIGSGEASILRAPSGYMYEV